MNKLLTRLFQAQRALPTSIPASEQRDMLLTLLFWKMLSERQRGKARYRESSYNGADPMLLHMVQQNRVNLSAASLYEACHWPTPFEAGVTLRTALYQCANEQTNRAFHTVLRPERYGRLSTYHTVLSNSTGLADAAKLIGGLTFEDPDLTIGHLFQRAMETLPGEPNDVPGFVAQLLVELLNPGSGSVICDPAFGSGQLLRACVDYVAANYPGHKLVLLGQENQSSPWALTKMQLLVNGLLLHRLERADVLEKPMLFGERLSFLPADVVLSRLPDRASPWDHQNAAHENYKRFPGTPPKDSRLALIWTMLAAMKPVVGRMGVLMPADCLDSREGMVLRRTLLERNWLDAIIKLPRPKRKTDALQAVSPALLLVRQQREHDQVAIITGQGQAGQPLRQYDARTIKLAYGAFQARQSHASLHPATGAELAARPCVFEWPTPPTTP